MRLAGLQVEHLSVSYPTRPDRRAVSDATFNVKPGEGVALVGPSGSGKSSLLMAIAGAIDSVGRVTWNGLEISSLPIHRRGVGLVFQDGQLFEHLTVGQNVGFGLKMRGTRAIDIERRVADLLDLVDLSGYASRRVTELSGGERQRVALIRSLAPQPRVLLLDEPLSSLDAELRTRLSSEIPAILKAVHATWIVVTHDINEAATMADRIITMQDGKLSQ